ncbi:AGE family epimerase/isomerase [Aquabacter spiritensis]|uniref:Mannose-6-phosphate isomerase type 3 n=1 Tax=Aquabacter spiritensis TaxID=933073 RepID=A0A4R3LRP1_9HYPH|nr:AGE family epimerase/isomerase [Aquabacter spiritensis]TCT02416.1 mannose-6-phosphate isomerase type 3 [Aquabacter spiritensis]
MTKAAAAIPAEPAYGAARAALLAWLRDTALPLWADRGIDRAAGGFYEGLTPDGRPTDDPRRARVVARQIYVFSVARHLGWDGPADDIVRHGLAALARHLTPDGRLIPTLGTKGETVRDVFDLYDHAFVLFALAAAARAGLADEAPARALLARMVRTHAHPVAGFHEGEGAPLKANPHMHLFEACLEWEALSADQAWSALADAIAELCLSRLIHPETGAVHEYFDATWQRLTDRAGSVVEPGHQFEWAWLLMRWGAARGRPDALIAARRLVALAERHGVKAGFAMCELNADLTLRDGRARLWPQTERIKAQVVLVADAAGPDARGMALARATEAVQALMRFFDHPVPGGWWEYLSLAGEPEQAPSRASSLYHIVCAAAVLAAASA